MKPRESGYKKKRNVKDISARVLSLSLDGVLLLIFRMTRNAESGSWSGSWRRCRGTKTPLRVAYLSYKTPSRNTKKVTAQVV